MDVQMPDGTIVTGVPDNITQTELLARFNKFKAPPVPQNKGTLGDLGTALKQGVARIPEGLAGLADIPVELITGENYITEAGKKLADVTGLHPSEYAKSLEAEKSAGYQQAQAEANALWKAHDEGKASYGDIAAFYASHPALTATNVVESAPSMVVGGVYGRALKGVGALSAVARGAIGEGAVSAGQLNAAMNEEGGGSRQKALAAALGGAGTGLIAGGSGALARRMGVIDPETFLAGKSGSLSAKELADFEQAAQRGIAARLGLGALQEGVLQELPQSVQEQMFQNWGTGKPIMEGVGRQAIEGLLAGAVLGGGFNVLGRGDVNQQIQDRKDADAQQVQRQATGVMEQQPLFDANQAPIPPIAEPTLTPPEAPISTIAPEEAPVEQPVPAGQGDLFTRRGTPTKDALASVEAARVQGIPAQVEQLKTTPEGRAELSANMKAYYPDLSVKERNVERLNLQRMNVVPVVAPEGTLTPEILKSVGIVPNNRTATPIYNALVGTHITNPTTYNLLATLADTPSKSDIGIKANTLLDKFQHFNPNAVQSDLFPGERNAPEAQIQTAEPVQATQATEPVQADLFGVSEDGVRDNTEQQRVEPSLDVPVSPAPTEIKEAPKLKRGRVDVPVAIPEPDNGAVAVGTAVQPSALAPVPKGEAKKAAQALKKEPVAVTWGYMSDTPYATLSKVSKDKVNNAHDDNYLTQELADEIDYIESGNARAEAANAVVKPETPLDETPTTIAFEKEGEKAAVKESKKSMSIGAGKSDNTAKSVRDTISELFASTPLFDNKVHIFNNIDEAVDAEIVTEVHEFGAQGVYKNGKIYLIAENIPKGAELAVMLHEVGVHLGMTNLLGNTNMRHLSDQIQSFAIANNSSLESKIALAAMSRIPSNTNPAHMDEELIAYFVEEAVLAGVNPMAVESIKSNRLASWFRKFMAATKAVLRKVGLARFDLLKTKDIVNLAYGAADMELAGAYHGTAATFRTFNHDYMSSGEGAQAYGWGTYLAQKRGIGEDYRRQDTARKNTGYISIAGKKYPGTHLRALMSLLSLDYFHQDGIPRSAMVENVMKRLMSGAINIHIAKAALAQIASDIKMSLTVDSSLDAETQAEMTRQVAGLGQLINDMDKFQTKETGGDEGSLMHVRPMMHDDELLDLDKKVINQSPLVQKALMRIHAALVKANALDDILEIYNADWEDLTGKEIYEGVLGHAGRESLPALPEEYTQAMQNDEFASKYLDSIGIKGSKFLDSTSRNEDYNSVQVRDQGYQSYSPNDPWGDGPWVVELQGPHGGKITGWYPTEPEANRAANKERAKIKLPTRNLVIFNDKNIARAATYGGGQNDTGKNKYSINPQAQALAQQTITNMAGPSLHANTALPRSTPTQIAQQIATTMTTNPTGAFGMIEDIVNKVRTKAIDKAATLAATIQDQNDGAFRDVNGQMRADLLLSAANNMRNYVTSFYAEGGIEVGASGEIHTVPSQHRMDGVYLAAQPLYARLGNTMAGKLVNDAFFYYRAKAFKALPQADWPENWIKDPSLVPTDTQINTALNAFNQFPELEAMRQQFIGTKNNLVKFLRQVGFLSAEKERAFLADDSYAPWIRIKDYTDKASGLGNIGRMVDLRQLKAVVGGSEEVNDMLENMAQFLAWGVRSGIANHSANAALKTMKTMNIATQYPGRPSNVDSSHTVMTYENGKPTFWQVDNPWHLAAFQTVKGMNSIMLGHIGRALGTLRAGIVLFPAFPVRQIVMDSQRAFMEAGVEHPWRMMGKIWGGIADAYKGTHADVVNLRRHGVTSEVDFNIHDTPHGRAADFGLGEHGKTITDRWVHSPAYKFLHALAYTADMAVRLGIYRQTMEETGDVALATTRSREIINFQKSGTSELLHTLKGTIPFLGAFLQGTDVNYRSMVGRGNSMKSRKAAAAAYWTNMAMYSGLVIAYTMMMSGDDDYEEQKGFITDRNFLIPGGGLLPVPPDVGFLAKVVPERITDYILQNGTDNPESAARLRQGLLQAMATGFLPPAAVYGVTPAVELMLNKSFFSDLPIVGQRYQGLQADQQYTPSTSELAKTVGSITGQSPLQIDYIINAIGGTSAGAILQLADVIGGSNKMASDKLPLVGSFQQKTVGGRYAEEYYAVRELVDKAYNTAVAIQMEGDQAKLEAYLAQPKIQERLQAHTGIESIHAALNEVSHQRNMIANDPSLSPQEKRDATNTLMAQVEAGLKDMGIRNLRSEIE
jgi:hypothetical protein